MPMSMQRKKFFAILLIGLFLGWGIGFTMGVSQGIKWAVGLGLNFLELKGFEITPDMEEILYNVESFQHNLNRCYGEDL